MGKDINRTDVTAVFRGPSTVAKTCLTVVKIEHIPGFKAQPALFVATVFTFKLATHPRGLTLRVARVKPLQIKQLPRIQSNLWKLGSEC